MALRAASGRNSVHTCQCGHGDHHAWAVASCSYRCRERLLAALFTGKSLCHESSTRDGARLQSLRRAHIFKAHFGADHPHVHTRLKQGGGHTNVGAGCAKALSIKSPPRQQNSCVAFCCNRQPVPVPQAVVNSATLLLALDLKQTGRPCAPSKLGRWHRV